VFLVCDILINVLLQTSALFGPLYVYRASVHKFTFSCCIVSSLSLSCKGRMLVVLRVICWVKFPRVLRVTSV
jgi:hypothetical protein